MNDEQIGSFLIVLHCCTLRYIPNNGWQPVHQQKTIQRIANITRSEAAEFAKQHRIGVSYGSTAGDYSYQWQADTELL